MSSAETKDAAGWTQAPGSPERAFYGQDEYGWLLHQAGLLRAGRLEEVDRASLAEFLTDMAFLASA